MQMLLAAIGMTLASVQADEGCRERLQDPELERGEGAMQVLFDSRCKAYREVALTELEAWLSSSLVRPLSGDELEDPETDAENRGTLAWLVASQRVRLALEANDVATARTHLRKLPNPPAQEFLEHATIIRPQILDILDGKAAPPDPRFNTPPNWILAQGFCGTPLVTYLRIDQMQLSVADAWRAMGRPDLAIAQVLGDEWTKALSLGTVPPRLREHAEAWLGTGGYEREVEIALRGLRLEKGVTGTHLTLPLFGHALPLPVGYQSWDEPEPTRFPSAEAAAEFYRAWLLERHSLEP
ncbi:MAG: hypothetical protein MUE46_10200 [Xanthomonadales bacterium]|jgi:hypothetical protein|nr:hypothetical protein [Xanthomonadales bacterium]